MGKTRHVVPGKESLPKLTPQEQKFIAHYVVHFNGAEAVRFAGYKSIRPNEYARELLTRKNIQAHVEELRKELGTLHFDIYNRAVAKLIAMMEADRTALFDADGNLLDPKEWPEDLKLLLAGIEIEETMVGEGDEAQMVRTKKVKLEGPKGIIDSLAKLTGHLVDRTQLLDKNGKPTDPPPAAAPIINLTVGKLEAQK